MNKFIYFVFICSYLLILSCAFSDVSDKKKCSSAADCVPVECCHAPDVVNRKFAPDCTDILCTEECLPNTLDCGQAEITCHNQECQAVYLGLT